MQSSFLSRRPDRIASRSDPAGITGLVLGFHPQDAFTLRTRRLARRIKIVLVLPPSPEPCCWSAPHFLLRPVPVGLRRTSRQADPERRAS
jgi:hypothetical protein